LFIHGCSPPTDNLDQVIHNDLLRQVGFNNQKVGFNNQKVGFNNQKVGFNNQKTNKNNALKPPKILKT